MMARQKPVLAGHASERAHAKRLHLPQQRPTGQAARQVDGKGRLGGQTGQTAKLRHSRRQRLSGLGAAPHSRCFQVQSRHTAGMVNCLQRRWRQLIQPCPRPDPAAPQAAPSIPARPLTPAASQWRTGITAQMQAHRGAGLGGMQRVQHTRQRGVHAARGFNGNQQGNFHGNFHHRTTMGANCPPCRRL